MDDIYYHHKDRHPSCCCTQCVADEGAHDVEFIMQRVEMAVEFLRNDLYKDRVRNALSYLDEITAEYQSSANQE
jgi:hypothetical protein